MTKDTELLRRQLQRRDPAPFIELLIQVLQNAPSAEDLQKFAKAQPDRFVKMTSQLARVVGYSESVVVDHRDRLAFEEMNDLELLQYVRAQRKAISLAIPLQAINAEAVEVDTATGGPANHGPDPADLKRLGLGEPDKEDPSKQ